MFFIKVGQKEHLEQIQKEGLLYCNTFAYFKSCQNQEQLDPHENVTEICKGGKLTLDGTEFELDQDESVIVDAPSLNAEKFTHLFCMFYAGIGDEVRDDFKIIDEKFTHFGDYILIIHNQQTFLNKLEKSLKLACKNEDILNYKGKRVEYVDFDDYVGELGPFRKSINYKHHSEWRLALFGKPFDQAYKLYLGSLEDISVLMPISKCKNRITQNKDGSNNIEF